MGVPEMVTVSSAPPRDNMIILSFLFPLVLLIHLKHGSELRSLGKLYCESVSQLCSAARQPNQIELSLESTVNAYK